MSWSEVSDHAAVRRAVAEFDKLGAHTFYRRYRFGPPKTQALVIDGREYPSKAILGVAHGYQFPTAGPLRGADFTGGEHTVKRVLEKMGFEVRAPTGERSYGASVAEQFVPGTVYTRQELREEFNIRDATLNNGVFPRLEHGEVWLFVTENKTPDRTQYVDLLEGDTLRWQGQTAGRTDHLIIEHAARELRLLVFYRRSKSEYPGAGFRFAGEFGYVSHSGASPTAFVLSRVGAGRRDVADEVLQAVEDAVRGYRRARRVISAAEVKAIERRAVEVATEHYVALGWSVEDVGATESYDLLCTLDNEELHVEVKGTTGTGAHVGLTRNEVNHARDFPRVSLTIVADIVLDRSAKPEPTASGGRLTRHDPWRIDEGTLEPLTFEYSPPKLD